MKRSALLKHLRKHGCYLKREGVEHSLWTNPNTVPLKPSHAVPRCQILFAARYAVTCPFPNSEQRYEIPWCPALELPTGIGRVYVTSPRARSLPGGVAKQGKPPLQHAGEIADPIFRFRPTDLGARRDLGSEDNAFPSSLPACPVSLVGRQQDIVQV